MAETVAEMQQKHLLPPLPPSPAVLITKDLNKIVAIKQQKNHLIPIVSDLQNKTAGFSELQNKPLVSLIVQLSTLNVNS